MLAVAMLAACSAVCAVNAGGTRFVAVGWEMDGALTPEKLKANQPALARTGLSGIGVALPRVASTADPSNVLSHAFSDAFEWRDEDLAGLACGYRGVLALPGLRHSFLCQHFHNPSPGHPSRRAAWSDDETWRRKANNMRVAARFAKEGGFAGICIDNEDYGAVRQFAWMPSDGTYAEACALARRRAAEVFAGVFREFPDAEMLFFWFLSERPRYFSSADARALAEACGDLWPAFADGLLDVATPQAAIIDGNEHAYLYKSEDGDFERSCVEQRGKAAALVSPENRRKFRSLVRAGFGLYMDMYENRRDPLQRDGGRWRFDPVDGSRTLRFDRNATAAAAAADGLVWLWGERRPWIDWKPGFPAWLARDGTWPDVLPGVCDVVAAISDPEAYAERRHGELSAAGRLRDVIWNGACEPHGAGRPPAGFSGDADGTSMPPPFYCWIDKSKRHGLAGLDVGGGPSGGNALRFDGVEDGCAMYNVPEDARREGDMFVFEAKVKGRASVRLSGRQTAVGGDPSKWRVFRGLVRIGEKAPSAGVSLCVSQNEDETTRFADMRLYRVFRHRRDPSAAGKCR